MINHYGYATNIAVPVNSLTEFINFKKQDNLLRFMKLQSPQIQHILFTQDHEGGDDDPIVPPN